MKQAIVGGNSLELSVAANSGKKEVFAVNTAFWDTVGSEALGVTALPSWGGFLPDESRLKLLGDLTGKRVLEIGCGNGRSIEYAAKLGAAELWGLDISANQIEKTREYLHTKEINAHLICAPMEEECNLPKEYFDVIYSVFGIGWTTDLRKTFQRMYSYLKTGGIFVFGWSHPIHKCVSDEENQFVIANSYFDESWYKAKIGNGEIAMSNRMLSTYINALADAGFHIERLVEDTDTEKAVAAASDFGRKALMLPTAFAIKSKKEVVFR